ncbi:hypothetical protein L208DRAFT_804694 [Tricholoma matsutake]|nr:hypothetical protein L208DRAFT_804694 [Tricholoma matsutake 945]
MNDRKTRFDWAVVVYSHPISELVMTWGACHTSALRQHRNHAFGWLLVGLLAVLNFRCCFPGRRGPASHVRVSSPVVAYLHFWQRSYRHNLACWVGARARRRREKKKGQCVTGSENASCARHEWTLMALNKRRPAQG